MKCRNFARILIVLTMLMALPSQVYADGDANKPYTAIRFAGPNRYETSFTIADELYKTTGEFENIVVAYGQNFPDALAGGYLAKEKSAPILLSEPAKESAVISYIKSHAAKGASVYILGGTGVITAKFERDLKRAGYQATRLGGADRFETNLRILNAVKVEGEELLVSDGYGFADSLSGSAVGKPILIVNKNTGLSSEQKVWLNSVNVTKIYILGGTGSVSNDIQKELKTYAPVKRLGGANRHETSALIAKEFFPKTKTVTIAFSGNFPDGLSGAPIALRSDAPMLLVSEAGYKDARTYVAACGADFCCVIGGTGALSNKTVGYVMGEEIINPVYINSNAQLPMVIYEGKYGTVTLKSVEHGWNDHFATTGYITTLIFDNKGNQEERACFGRVYLNNFRIWSYSEGKYIAPGKKGLYESFLYDEDIIDEMKGFQKIECDVMILDSDENELASRPIVIDSSVIVYK